MGVWSARLLVVSLLRRRCLMLNLAIAAQDCRTALMEATIRGNKTCVCMLLAGGADVTLRDKVWWPVWAAAGSQIRLRP